MYVGHHLFFRLYFYSVKRSEVEQDKMLKSFALLTLDFSIFVDKEVKGFLGWSLPPQDMTSGRLF